MFVILTNLFGQQMSYADYRAQQNKRFEEYTRAKAAEYDAYRQKQNERYAAFMAKSWERFSAKPAVEVTPIKPVDPVVYPDPDPDPTPTPKPKPEVEPQVIPVQPEVIVLPKPQPQPKPLADVEPRKDVPYSEVSVLFYGTSVAVGFPNEDHFRIKAITEKELANAWKVLSASIYDITLGTVLKAREELALCDWGYVELLQAVAEKRYGKTNEAVLMQAFLLAQSGYKIRLAYEKSQLCILAACDHGMVGRPYYMLDGVMFYPLTTNLKELYICNASFDSEKSLSLLLREEQKLKNNPTSPRTLTSKYGIVANVSVNKNALDFYGNYPKSFINNDPTTTWVVYANTPLEMTIRESLYPVLRESIEGMSERDAVNKLLNFVQTAFEYGYDDELWGGERTFFATETLYYPYSDCEDRSILFSRLVRDIMGLDVVLLYYPGHLATAVAFTQEVYGDYLQFKNHRYVVCDPTYIGAAVGRTMPGMNNQKAKIVVL